MKIVITVRDYSLNEIEVLCNGLSKKILYIEKLNDEHLIDIIKEKPFNILNDKYQNEIIAIADGNPRLAIMATLLALEKQDLTILQNVSELFENYFDTFINDRVNIRDKVTIQCLGLISFFYTLPYKDKEIIEPIIEEFGINYYELIDTIERLEKWELLEIQYEYVKIPEQNISNYFFYLAFINKRYLSLEILLEKFFVTKSDRFKECIIAANNSFGPEKVMEKVRPILIKYLNNIKKTEQSFGFLSTFWFYLQNEVLEYLYEKIIELPDVEIQEYNTFYESNQFAYNKNEVIELLGNYFKSIPMDLKNVIELSLEFIKKQPEHLPELICKFRETFSFELEDEDFGFYKQQKLFEVITNGMNKGDKLYLVIFYELAKTFLQFKFEVFKFGRENKFIFYKYELPNIEDLKLIRKGIWNNVNRNFYLNRGKSLDLLSSYCDNYSENNELIYFDKEYIINLIKQHLDTTIFEHCLFVQKYIKFLNRHSIKGLCLDELKEKYRNELYEMYLKIDWDRIRDKEVYDFKDYNEYLKLKEKDIRKSFEFQTSVEIKNFFERYLYLIGFTKNNWNQNGVLDIIVDETFKKNSTHGFVLINLIVEKNNELNYIPYLVFKNHLNRAEMVNKFLSIIETKDFNQRLKWAISLYENVEKSLLNIKEVNQFFKLIKDIDETVEITVQRLQHFENIKEDFNRILLETITQENHKREYKIQIQTRGQCLVSYLKLYNIKLDTLKEMYSQQFFIDPYIDFEGEVLKYILKIDPTYLIEFIKEHYVEEEQIFQERNGYGFLWGIENLEYSLEKIFEFTLEKDLYFGMRKHFGNVFFKDIEIHNIQRAKHFILEYVKKNNENIDKMNIVLDIVNNTREEWFDEVITVFIHHNQDFKNFSGIWWTKRSRVYSGEKLISDIEAADWRRILDIINEIDLGIKLIPIKKFIITKIELLVQGAEEERKRRYLRKD
ncbi:hypothetical protein SIL80_02775 [Bacillus cereus group sp. BfR-BA-01119]|uniref:hypothetical protein n=1 Tax=unclassified Bacillus cereus group TaxID=2750818 RepID=UPI0029C1847E|nr:MULTISPECIES: hypothetical protein [unclassified Bacillus cereus group]MDX5864821.1 hypothetical protein [Bacillus cereus group sp. BfR-BA-01119]MDX5908176.1 hypothetical protein [Bacillus cereus group sp. BfR-BA-01029]